MTDVVVIGGGVIGCASALALAERGARVIVIEERPFTTDAAAPPGPAGSSAAAGILGAQLEARHDGPLARLCIMSRARYAAWLGGVIQASGRDVELRACGVMRVAFDEASAAAIAAEVAWHAQAGLRLEPLDAAAVRKLEPSLSHVVAGGVRFPDDPRLDPPSLISALRLATERAGVVFRKGEAVRRVLVHHERAAGVALERGDEIAADAVVLAAGSWSSLIEGSSLPREAVRPARGQIIELAISPPLLSGIVEGPACYLSPRDDGRVLVGSTVELAGFAPVATAGAMRELLEAAIKLVPALEGASVRRAWGGLRPYTRDELPIIGPSSTGGLFLATGHFRNGVLLAPITGEIIAALVMGEAPAIDLAPFSPARFSA